MPFETWKQTAPWAPAIAAATGDRTMPPWSPAETGECGPFLGSLALDDDAIATFGAWSDAGAPEGDSGGPASDAPPVRALPRIDVTLTLPEPYTPNAALIDDYRCFLVDPRQPVDRYITGVEVLPGNLAQVHHIGIIALGTERSVIEARVRDRADPGSGWDCSRGLGFSDSITIAGYVPGSDATEFPAGTGIPLEGGRPLVLYFHYNTLNGVVPDNTIVELMLEDSVEVPARIERFNARDFVLPPGEPSTMIVSVTPVKEAMLLFGVAPHQHTLGSAIRAEVLRADGSTDCIVDVPRWDFHWQGYYYYREPVRLNKGDLVWMTCEWNTVGADQPVQYGEAATDEMCATQAYVTPDRDGPGRSFEPIVSLKP